MHVLVIGGGLGGLSAGLAAQQAGHHVTVLERAPRLRDDGAGIGLPPNGVLALDALGLGAQLRERAGTHDHGGGLHDRHGRVLLAADRRAMEARTGATLLAVRRPWLHGLLADALEPGTIRTDCPVTDVRDRGHDVEVTAGGEVVHADAAVVADGAGSRLRTLLFPEHPGLARSGEFAARAVAPHLPSDLPLVVGELLDNRTGDRFGCLPLGDGGAFWYATWKGAAPEDPVLRRRWLRERRAGWHPAVPALIDATAPEEVHVVETSRLRTPLPALARGRIALLGDAAHAMTPDLGQGACQAFEDAVVLGAAVTGSEPFRVAAALREYDAQRRPRTTSLQRESRRMHRLLRMSGPMARLRDAAFRRIPPRLSARALAAQFRFDPPDAASREPLRSR